jgi:hypothetical protein
VSYDIFPLRYRIHETGIGIATMVGRVAMEEVSPHVTDLRADPRIQRPMCQLVEVFLEPEAAWRGLGCLQMH